MLAACMICRSLQLHFYLILQLPETWTFSLCAYLSSYEDAASDEVRLTTMVGR